MTRAAWFYSPASAGCSAYWELKYQGVVMATIIRRGPGRYAVFVPVVTIAGIRPTVSSLSKAKDAAMWELKRLGQDLTA